jgi:hypothetical protein
MGCLGELWLLLRNLPTESEDVKRFESKKHVFERVFVGMVALGVTMELIVLPKSLNESAKLISKNLELERQLGLTRTNVAEIDPMNQPVFDISASAVIYVKKGSYKFNSIPAINTVAIIHIMQTNAFILGNVPIYLSAKSYTTTSIHLPTNRTAPIEDMYVLHLEWPQKWKSMLHMLGEKAPNVSALLNSCNGLMIRVMFLPEGAEICAGIADLVINGSVHKQFDIVGKVDGHEDYRNVVRSPFSPLHIVNPSTNYVLALKAVEHKGPPRRDILP